MVNFDTHWGGRRGPNGPYEVDYNILARQARDALGVRGIVAVPNARGPDHEIGPEYRFEELLNLAENSRNGIQRIGDGRVFYDTSNQIYFVKGQEVNTTLNGEKLVFMVYGLPLGENLPEKNEVRALGRANQSGYPVALTAPSCIGCFEKLVNEDNTYFMSSFDAVITHTSTAATLDWPLVWRKAGSVKHPNKRARRLYGEITKHLVLPHKKRVFTNFFTKEKFHIGQLAVSKGHRALPQNTLKRRLFCPPSIGSSYSEIEMAQEYSSAENFLEDLREGIRNSQEGKKGSAVRETLTKHWPAMQADVKAGYRDSIN